MEFPWHQIMQLDGSISSSWLSALVVLADKTGQPTCQRRQDDCSVRFHQHDLLIHLTHALNTFQALRPSLQVFFSCLPCLPPRCGTEAYAKHYGRGAHTPPRRSNCCPKFPTLLRSDSTFGVDGQRSVCLVWVTLF
jgi:hypothetical protein